MERVRFGVRERDDIVYEVTFLKVRRLVSARFSFGFVSSEDVICFIGWN